MLGLETDGEADQSYGDDGAEFVKTVDIKRDPAFDIIDYPAEVIRPVVTRLATARIQMLSKVDVPRTPTTPTLPRLHVQNGEKGSITQISRSSIGGTTI